MDKKMSGNSTSDSPKKGTVESSTHAIFMLSIVILLVLFAYAFILHSHVSHLQDELAEIRSSVNNTNYLINRIFPIYDEYLFNLEESNKVIPLKELNSSNLTEITLNECSNSLIMISSPLCSYCVMQESILTNLGIPYKKACAEWHEGDYYRCLNDSTFLQWNISYPIVRDFSKLIHPNPIIIPTLIINCTHYREGTIAMYNETREMEDLRNILL